MSGVGTFWVCLCLFFTKPVKLHFLGGFEIIKIGLFEQSFYLEHAFLKHLQLVDHQCQVLCLGSCIKSSSINNVFFDDLMQQSEWIFDIFECCRLISFHHAFLQFTDQGIEFNFEGRPPRNAILFFLLNVLAWHVSCVVQDIDVSLHHLGAKYSSFYKFSIVNLRCDEALLTACSLRFEVEHFFWHAVTDTHVYCLCGNHAFSKQWCKIRTYNWHI